MDASDPVPPSASSLDSIRELELDAKRKKKKALLVLIGAIPVVGAAGAAAWYFGQQGADAEIAAAYNQASGCLVGAPLADGEKASLRMRAIQLAAVHAERDQQTRWPIRCADDVAALFEALRRHGRNKDGDQGLAALAEPLAVELRKASVMTDLSTRVDGFFTAARAMGLTASPISLSLPTPEPAKGFDLDSLPAGARITPLQYTLDSVLATPMIDVEIHVLVYDKKVDPKPILCSFGPNGDDRCRELGGELVGKSGLELGATVEYGASPLVLAGRDGDGGVYRSDGAFEKITDMEVQSAYVAKDGYVALAGHAQDDDEGRFELVEQPGPGAPLRHIDLSPGSVDGKARQIHRKELLWGKLMAQVLFDGDDAKPRLLYADLPVSGHRPKFIDIAEVDWVRARIFGCRTPETMVVGVGATRGFLTFLESDKWSAPVALESLSPAFGCQAGEAVFTSWGDQLRCTPAGCKDVPGDDPSFSPFKVRESYWADLNGKILAVASTEQRGGLRYRWADGKNLAADGGDALLFDDHVKGGAVVADSTLLGLLLAGRGRYAVVLLTTPNGVYALRFDENGQPKPANIRR